MSISVPVGPVHYTVHLVARRPLVGGCACDAICDSARCRIDIWVGLDPQVRVGRFFHEFGHALKTELDITDSKRLTEEAICNLIGIGFGDERFTLKLFTRLMIYLKQSITAEDAILYNGERDAIPIINMIES